MCMGKDIEHRRGDDAARSKIVAGALESLSVDLLQWTVMVANATPAMARFR